MYARSLVPGDIVYLSTGDRVPADIRLFEVQILYNLKLLKYKGNACINDHSKKSLNKIDSIFTKYFNYSQS